MGGLQDNQPTQLEVRVINVDIITRDESEGVTYFVGELKEGEYYGLFSLYDLDAADNLAATLEFVAESPDKVMELLKVALRERVKGAKKSTPATDSEEQSDDKPARRKRIAAK